MAQKIDDQYKLFQLEKKNLRYLNLFRVFIALFFYVLANNQQVIDFYTQGEFHLLVKPLANAYILLSLLMMTITLTGEHRLVAKLSKYVLYADLFVMIYFAFGTNGFEQGLALLPVLVIGSAAMMHRKSWNILLAPVIASGLLWGLPNHMDFSNQDLVTDSSRLLHALGYFAIALLGMRQSISYSSTLELYKNQRKTISGLEDMNQIIIEKLTNGVIVYQADYVILHANQSAKKLLGVDDLIFIPDEIINYLESNKDGEVYQAANGNDLYLRKASVNEEKNFGVLFIEDSSFLKKAAQQLNLASLGKLSSSIAHEIRNPLAAISTAAELLVESEHLKKQDREISEIIVNQTRRANYIIEDILEMSKRKTAKPEMLNISELLSQAKAQLVQQGLADGKDIQIVASNQATIQFDPDHIKQVIWNLASNGIKHGETKQLQMIVRNNVLDFKNAGEAFEENKVKNLFEPFFTTHNRGTGLGLHICRQLCHDNHATLDYLHVNNQHIFRLEFNLV